MLSTSNQPLFQPYTTSHHLHLPFRISPLTIYSTLSACLFHAPASSSGFELRLDETGGRLVDNGRQTVALRWFDRAAIRGERGELTWYFPAEALGPATGPDSTHRVSLWSQPRFQVE